jgi:hypothetical protein
MRLKPIIMTPPGKGIGSLAGYWKIVTVPDPTGYLATSVPPATHELGSAPMTILVAAAARSEAKSFQNGTLE